MHRFDDLDVRIIKELASPASPQWNLKQTYSNIARRLGVDEETVRRRLKRAEERGVIPGWRMVVNPHLVGCQCASLDLDVQNEKGKDRAIAEIKLIDGVIKILDFRGSGLQVTLYYPNPDALRRKTELIGSICGCPEPTTWELNFPRSHGRMTRTDWQIINEMLDDPRRSLQAVAKAIGVSLRSVERRTAILKENYAVYLQGIPNFRVFAGLSCVFLVSNTNPQKKSKVDHTILSKIRRTELSNTSSRAYSTFVNAFDNLSEADDTVKWIQALDGVESVKMGIMKELIVVQDWLRDEVEKRITLAL